jgi:hypothetical protein
MHLVKGWLAEDGSMHSQVIRLLENEEGASQLCVVYSDENFDPEQPSYYYLRAVEPSTERWHTYDCARLPESERPPVCTDGSYPETIREMAWSSPIWYQPASQ